MAHVLYIGYSPDAPELARVRSACERGGHALTDVLHGLDAIMAIDGGTWDIVVIEASSALEEVVTLAQIIRERPRATDPHVVVLVDQPQLQDQVALMAAGADLVFDSYVSTAAFERVFRRSLDQPERLPSFLESVTRAWARAGSQVAAQA